MIEKTINRSKFTGITPTPLGEGKSTTTIGLPHAGKNVLLKFDSQSLTKEIKAKTLLEFAP